MAPLKIDNVLTWAPDLDDATIAQARTTASMPFVEKPLALMPDAHLGLGSTVGSVVATSGAIMPSCVGVDIRCGMIVQRLSCAADRARKLSRTTARKTLSTDSLDRAMADIAWNRDSSALLDEHPDAYKDLGTVMENQADLVRIVHRLEKILNYKGV